MTTKIQVSQV